MIQSGASNINAWSHLVDLVVEPPQPKDPIEALKAAQSGKTPPTLRVPLVFTGIYGGPIHLTIEVLDREPETVTPGWED
ncbi:hypothetical protein [Arthrobacter sp. U41]|uniref:hypothetical protein n=1 Tax=Arthrobacter sp. U41 TaxID=1849032 RepID=UPI0012F7D3E2|nr:hypothetical protein [Arthrobacter sp. U41]